MTRVPTHGLKVLLTQIFFLDLLLSVVIVDSVPVQLWVHSEMALSQQCVYFVFASFIREWFYHSTVSGVPTNFNV